MGRLETTACECLSACDLPAKGFLSPMLEQGYLLEEARSCRHALFMDPASTQVRPSLPKNCLTKWEWWTLMKACASPAVCGPTLAVGNGRAETGSGW